jgi:hypothetical protein
MSPRIVPWNELAGGREPPQELTGGNQLAPCRLGCICVWATSNEQHHNITSRRAMADLSATQSGFVHVLFNET